MPWQDGPGRQLEFAPNLRCAQGSTWGLRLEGSRFSGQPPYCQRASELKLHAWQWRGQPRGLL
eukprot:1362428-Pyramimonas_sp.AAC.1